MTERARPRLIAGRATDAEHALVIAAAKAGGQTQSDFVRAVMLEAARRRLRESLGSGDPTDELEGVHRDAALRST